MSDEWATLAAVEDRLWARLVRAADDGDDPWRLVALATTGRGGPQVRTVALRAADRAEGVVEVHTDARAPKVGEVIADPRAQLLFWDEASQEQLRLSVVVAVTRGDPDRWFRIPDSARVNYATEPEPGAVIEAPDIVVRRPAPEKFAALVGSVWAADAVCLATDPHRRAVLRDGTWRWAAP